MVENGELKGNTFEMIVDIFMKFFPFDQAVTIAWMFCKAATGETGSHTSMKLEIPVKQPDVEFAEYMVSKGFTNEEIKHTTRLNIRTIEKARARVIAAGVDVENASAKHRGTIETFFYSWSLAHAVLDGLPQTHQQADVSKDLPDQQRSHRSDSQQH